MSNALAKSAGPLFAHLPEFTTQSAHRLAFVADPHVAVDATGTWKCFDRTKTHLRTALRDINNRDVDQTVFIGDLTKDGTTAEFEAFDELVAALDSPWFALPGNHDVPKEFDSHSGRPVTWFADHYAEGRYPYRRDVGELSILALDSASGSSLADTWGGTVDNDTIRWLDRTLQTVSNPVVTLHHNLAPLPEHTDGAPWNNFPIRNGERLRRVLSRHDVPVTFSGHHHVPAARRTDGGVEFMAPAVCSFPQAYLLVEIGPNGTDAHLVPLAEGDVLWEAYLNARNHARLGRGIASMTTTRLESLPLLE